MKSILKDPPKTLGPSKQWGRGQVLDIKEDLKDALRGNSLLDALESNF